MYSIVFVYQAKFDIQQRFIYRIYLCVHGLDYITYWRGGLVEKGIRIAVVIRPQRHDERSEPIELSIICMRRAVGTPFEKK